MPVEQHPITDRASWLKLRERDVTASAAAALLGVHEYQTAYGLWALKTGRIQEEHDESAPMRRGRLLEPVAIRLLQEERPEWTVTAGNLVYFRDPVDRLGATPDCFVVDESGSRGVVQIKSVDATSFRRRWRDPETDEVSPPVWIAVQALIEAHLTGAQWAAVAALVVSHGVSLEIVDVPLNLGVIRRVREDVRAFWRLVESGHTPDPDYGRDLALLERFYAPSDAEVADLSADNLLPALLDERATLTEQKSAAEKRLKEIKAELLAKLGTASAARVADGRLITAARVDRGAYQVKPTSFVDVRVKAAPAQEKAA